MNDADCGSCRRFLGFSTLLAILACGAERPRLATPPALPPPLPKAAALMSCNADAERDEARARYVRGEWFAALRRFQRADELCPGAHESREVAALTKKLAVTGAAGGELLDAARAAVVAGHRSDASLLEDRAALALETFTGARLAARLPTPGRDELQSIWTADSAWLLTINDDGLALRRRDEWYPRYRRALAARASILTRATLSDDGATLLYFTYEDEPDGSTQRWLRVVDVRPGPALGRELARFRTPNRFEPAFLGKDRVAFVEAHPNGSPNLSSLAVYSLKSAKKQAFGSPRAGDFIDQFALSPDGAQALLKWVGRLSLVDIETGSARDLRGPGVTWHDPPFSPDGRFVAWQDGASVSSRVIVHDQQTGKERSVHVPACDPGSGWAFDDASRTLALGGARSQLCLIDLASGRARSLRPHRLEHPSAPESLAESRAWWVYDEPRGALLDAATGKELLHTDQQLGVLYVDDKPTLVAADGSLTIVEPSLELRRLEAKPRPSSSTLDLAMQLKGEVALQFGNEWLIASLANGATRPLELSTSDAEVSPDFAYISANTARVPTVVSVTTGKVAPGSPAPLARDVELGPLGESGFFAQNYRWRLEWRRGRSLAHEPRKVENHIRTFWSDECGDALLRESSGRVGLVRESAGEKTLHASIDCATGRRGPEFAIDGMAMSLLNPTRVGGYGLGSEGGVTIWDASTGRKLFHVAAEQGIPSGAAQLSADDRFLFYNGAVFDVKTSRRVVEPAALQGHAGFIGASTLLAEEPGRFGIFRAPTFARAGTLLFSADLRSMAVVATDPSGAVTALEVLGDPGAFDATLDCGVDVYGVPFRICRQMLERANLLESLLE